MHAPVSRWLLGASTLAPLALALDIDTSSFDSIKAAASDVAYNLMHTYTGNGTGDTPGNLPAPFYWWEAGAMCGHMVDYYYYTGDSSYNQNIIQAIVWQAGNNGFMPTNQTKDEGNDDQVCWAFAALDAAELSFPAPSTGPADWVKDAPSWIAMAQAVFNLQVSRWDPDTCGGGLRWQLTPLNTGWDYKNIASNGGLFQLAARLARYTGNSTYLRWAEKEWDWMYSSALIDEQTWQVNDGIGTSPHDCLVPNIQPYSYNYGILLAGLAYAYNYTEDAKWLTPLQGILGATLKTFFPGDSKIMSEIICEPTVNCNADALTFKSFTLRWLAVTAQLVPTTADQIWPYISASAQGAAQQCVGTAEEETDVCGMLWNQTTWDGTYGPGQQMSALAAMTANIIPLKNLAAPVTLKSGGTSKSDPSAGTEPTGGGVPKVYTEKITTASKAGAGILTFLFLGGMLAGTFWLII